ncbi:MAG: hypothetical protein RLZZ26_448 [Candidatus Parcubacteria bacterium]|jgi:uncharacterized SAM-binding protein YcdF (DUF218 family)
MSLTPREKFLALIANDTLRKGDAIVVLEGDGSSRLPEAARLYQEGWAPVVVISGGTVNPPRSIPASEMAVQLHAAGVPREAIVLEERSLHTRAQAEEVIALVQKQGWARVLLVASHYHQFRAFLTFLKVLQERKLDRTIQLTSAPARQLPWFTTVDTHGARIDLLEVEFDRILRYGQEGYVASYESALDYLKWKESVV